MNPTETRLLGVLLDYAEAAEIAAALVHGSHFQSPVLGGIFDRVVALRARGVAVDADTLPRHYIEFGIPVPEEVPDPATWSRHDAIGAASELAALIRADFVRRESVAILTATRPALGDRAVDAMTTVTRLRAALTELVDENLSTEGGAKKLRSVLEMDDSYDWIIPGLLETQDRLVVTGPEGSGKTMLIRQIAVCASAGLQPFDLTLTEPKRVLIVDVENTERQWARSTATLAVRASQLGRRDPRDHVELICRGRLNLTDPTHEAQVHRWVDEYKPDLLALGPLYKLVPHAITNDDDAAPLITALDSLRDRGLTLLMEAHAGKANGADGERNLAPRGSSALLGWPEFGIGIRPLTDDPTFSQVVRWRGDRDAREWPRHLYKGSTLPWTPANR